MLVIISILLFFGLVVRHKWRNAAAKKDEILKLVAVTSEEEAEIEKLQFVEEYNLPQEPSPPKQLEKRYHCAVCYSPTTTRCSRCKSVRYCSGKCQIIHWRQGHKDECRPSPKQFETHSDDEAKTWSDPIQELDDTGSSSSSIPCFSSSTEHSDTSFDASGSEILESDIVGPVDTNHKVMRSTKVAADHLVPLVELRCSKCSKSLMTDEHSAHEAQICNDNETRSISFRSSSNHPKMPAEVEIVRTSHPTSKGMKTSLRKFVQQFRPTKQPKSCTFDTGGSYNHKVLFPPKLFMQLYSSDVEIRPFGLVNCGNSCYANAVLQCLTFTRPITLYLLQGIHSKTCRSRDWCFICDFESLVRKGQEVNSPLSPVGILSQIQRIGSNLSRGREEDAHEFLRDVVDTMQSKCLEEAGVSGTFGEDSTLLGLTFGGYLQSKIQCMKCSGRSDRFDQMLDLSVEIDGDIDTLEEALRKFTTSETLGGNDKYKCSRCKSYEKAKKKLTVVEAPNILTIVLKRFRSGNLEKLNKLVHFPEVLNLSPFMSGTNDKYPIYRLYAVIVHLNTMKSSHSGHYICYVKNLEGDWFRIDDSMVSPVDLYTVLSAEAYILFYARQTPRIPSSLRNNTVFSDGKTKRNMEAISSSNPAKKRNSKPKSISSSRDSESEMLHYSSSKNTYWNDSEDWEFHSKYRNSVVDIFSDNSSIFSASDAGSYSTDSTKDSSVDDISGYIFGSDWNHKQLR